MTSAELALYVNSRVIVKAAEFDRILSVEQSLASAAGQAMFMLEEAHRQAQELKAEALQAASRTHAEACQRGYRQGLQQASGELAELIVRTRSALAHSWQTQDGNICFLVTQVLAKVLAESDAEPHFFESVARRVMRAVRDQRFLVFKVAPEQLTVARAAVARAVAASGAPEFVEVQAGSEIPVGGCLIQTADSEINAGLNAQLEVLHKALMELFGQAGNQLVKPP